MRRRGKRKRVIASQAEYLAPLECDSRISFTIIKGGRYRVAQGAVIVTDCDRQIKWNLYHEEGYDPVTKLNNAIRILTAARDQWQAATKGLRKRRG